MDRTGLAAGGVISVLPIIVAVLFLQWYFIEGIGSRSSERLMVPTRLGNDLPLF